MKTIKILAVAAILASFAACSQSKGGDAASNGADSLAVAQPTATQNIKDLLPSKAEIDSVSYLLGINWGAMVKNYNMGDLNFNEIKKGMNDFVNSKGNQRDTDFVKQFKINPEQMNRIINEFLEKRGLYTAELNKSEEAKFLAANKTKDGVQSTESGLQYIIQEAGNDVKPGVQDTVYVHYKLSLRDGSVVEEVPASAPSVSFANNNVVSGWAEGLGLIGEGGKATLFVPSALGYGERGNQGIDPYSTLIFDIQLDSVKRYIAPTE